MQINQSQRFDNLYIVRFFLAYALIIFHAYTGWKENFGSPSFVLNEAGTHFSVMGEYIERVIHNFSLGGDVFFLISGFLITMILLKEQDETGDIKIRGFYIRRALRILPLYFLVLAASPIFSTFMHEKVPNYPYWFFLIGNLDLAYNGWGPISINYLWYTAIELQFYLLIPIALVIIRRKHLPLFFIFIIFLSFVFRISAFHSATPWNLIYLHTLSRMDVLAIGSWLGLILHQRKSQVLYNAFPMRLMLYFIFFYLLFVDEYADYSNIFYATTKKYTYILLCSYFIANYLFNPSARLVPQKKNLLHHFGKITFGLYIFSNLAVAVMIYFSKTYPELKNFWIYFTIVNILAISAALFSYKFIELPIRNLKQFFIKKSPITKTEQVL